MLSGVATKVALEDRRRITSFTGEHQWLSNFWACRVLYMGTAFESVEAAFQAAKSEAPEVRRQFASLSPSEAKRRGRQIQLRSDWEQIKLEIMSDLVRQKFQTPALRAQLLGTGERQLVEVNAWNDTFWGVYRGVGQNQLGIILMKVRSELRICAVQPMALGCAAA